MAISRPDRSPASRQNDRQPNLRLLPSDEALVEELLDRDGSQSDRWMQHTQKEGCRYAAVYPDGDCPWCQAEALRRA